jgi:hypothetical protein
MSIFVMIATVKKYIDRCPAEAIKTAAINDFVYAIKEIRESGYTWGRTHHLPFKHEHIQELSKEDVQRLINIIRHVSN